MKRCDHSDHIGMPMVPGRTTPLGRCRECNRDFDSRSGLLVAFRNGAYVYASSGRPVT